MSSAEGDSLVVLESDKASMEVPAPAAGADTGIAGPAKVRQVKQGDDQLVMRLEGAAVGSLRRR